MLSCQVSQYTSRMAGGGTADVAFRAQQLLEQSLLGELRAVVARALSGLEMFSGQLGELISGEVMAQPPPAQVRTGVFDCPERTCTALPLCLMFVMETWRNAAVVILPGDPARGQLHICMPLHCSNLPSI